MTRKRVLIVEDEQHLLAFYREALEQAGCSTRGARTGKEGLRMFAEITPDLVLLDLELIGGMDGLEVLSVIRSRSDVHVMILTGQVGDTTLVRGLNLGADNYVRKPVSRAELAARVGAHLRRDRRGRRALPSGVFHYGELLIDLGRSQAVRGSLRFTLGEVERRILARLLQTPGQPVSQQELLEIGWGQTERIVRWDEAKALMSCIHRLRAKLERNGGRPGLIETVPKAGFAIAAPDERPEPGGGR